MLDNELDEDVLDINIDDLFGTEENLDEDTSEPNSDSTEEPNMTKAVSKRINEVRKETEKSTRDTMARELGFDNYADLQNSREKQMFDEHGVDTEEIQALVEQLVQKRMNDDPRFKKLEEIEAQEKESFVRSQLKEISDLSGMNYTDVSQLSKETLNVWEKTGNLKQAFLATEGENLIGKSRTNKGTLSHLSSPGSSSSTKKRGLTADEKDIYRMVYNLCGNTNISEEELSKKTTDN